MKKALLFVASCGLLLSITGCAKWIDRGESITAVRYLQPYNL